MKQQKRRRKLLFMIMAILLTVWLIISCAFAAVSLVNEKEAQDTHSMLMAYGTEETFHQMNGATGFQIPYLFQTVNSGVQNYVSDAADNDDFVRLRDGNVQIQFYCNGKLTSDSNEHYELNLTSMDAVNSEIGYYDWGFAGYSDFTASLPDGALDEILPYMNLTEDDGSFYILSCTQYYFDEYNGRIYPKELQILKTDSTHTWYVEDEVIRKYTLSPKPSKYAVERKIGQMNRNIIPYEFLTGTFRGKDYLSAVKTGEYAQTVKQTGLFDYVFYYEDFLGEHITITSERKAEPNKVYTNLNSEENYVTALYSYSISFARHYNLLDGCLNNILSASGIMLLFFTAIGALIWLMTRREFQIQQLQERKRRDLTNALAHDIKTPLFVIGGYAQNLKENIHSEKRVHYAEVIQKQTESVNALVHRMLELSKLDSADFNPKFGQTDINEVLSVVLENYLLLPDARYIDCVTRGDFPLDCDKELIACALENLIDNAVKYSLPESVIQIRAGEGRFSISNPCEPISKGDLKKIWEPYYRIENVSRKNGNGLGLSIVKAIFELHSFEYGAVIKDGRITFWFDAKQ